MSRVDTFTIIRKHTKNKVRTSLIISSLEFVNNKNLLSYVCFPIIVKVSCVALKFWFFHKIFILVFTQCTPMAYWLWCYDASRKDSSLIPSTEKLVAQPQVTCIHGSFISKSNHISMSVLNALI